LHGRAIRVLQLGSPSGLFGAERWILALAKHLSRDRVETIVGAIQDGPSGSPEPPLCVQARAFGFETVTVTAPGRFSRAAIDGLRRVIQERGIDLVHTHFYKPTLVGVIATRGTACRLVATPHGWSTDAGLKLQAYQVAERLAFGWTDAVAPLSRDLASGLARLPWVRNKLCFIQNGVDLSEVSASTMLAPDVAEARREGAFVVGYIGQLIARKRVETLIDAFAALAVPSKRLFIVGDGDQATALSARVARLGIAGQVCFTGFRHDRLDLLRGFDVLVLPSVLEGIPRCLMEAMATGVPVIGTDIPGTRDLIEDGRTGWLFPVEDAHALADRLEALARDPVKAKGVVAAARDAVNRDFSAAGMAARYEALFQRISLARRASLKPHTAADLEG
jgi:glycosyltransferase involved in cell wall biosynthesis